MALSSVVSSSRFPQISFPDTKDAEAYELNAGQLLDEAVVAAAGTGRCLAKVPTRSKSGPKIKSRQHQTDAGGCRA
jgi:hypothetical protein